MSVIHKEKYFTSLPQPYYTSEEIYRREIEKVWHAQWLLAGHVSMIPNKGDYFTYELDTDSVIVVRGEGSAVHAHYNTCRHRGFRICEAGSTGNTGRRIVCRYHSWSYDLNGELKTAPQQADGESFEYRDFGLHAAHVEVWQGFIFLHFGKETPPRVADVLAKADEQLQPLELEKLKLVKWIEYPVKANWKLLMENELECYHCEGTHPELCESLSLADMYAHHGDWTVNEPYLHSWMPLRDGARSLTMDGEYAVKKLLGEFARGREVPEGFATGFLIQPTVSAALFNADCGMLLQMIPDSIGETRLVCGWFVNEDAVEGEDYDVDKLIHVWNQTHLQDVELAEGQQKGVLSSRYVPGPNSAIHEPGMRSALELYLEMMGDHTNLIPH